MENSTPQHSSDEAKADSPFHFFPFYHQKQAMFVLVLLGLIFYGTSLYNEYALDDGIVIHQNNDVLKGAAGIKNIMSTDVYANFYERMNASDQLMGGRYRPLSIVSFALEQELIGTYRSGYYMMAEDLNKNGKLDPGLVTYTVEKHKPDDHEKTNKLTYQNNYEYNHFKDLNNDGVAQADECYNCWDSNKNFKNDAAEDLNKDGVFNEIDCQVKGAFIRHFNQVILYVLLCVLLYVLFYRYLFAGQQDIAFLAALLFLIHPVHSEVVANVKSRDDLLSLIFIVLGFISAFAYEKNKKPGQLLLFLLCLFLALLSKEYALLMPLLLPIAMHVFGKSKLTFKPMLGLYTFFTLIIFIMLACVWYKVADASQLLWIDTGLFVVFVLAVWFIFRNQLKDKQTVDLIFGMQAVVLLYMVLRLSAVNTSPGVEDTEILNNPYLLASAQEAFATKIFVLLKYLRLSLFPHPLVSDYSFNSIPYKQLFDPAVIFSLLLHVGLLVIAVRATIKRQAYGFALLLYFIFLIPVTNFIFPIGATMGERMLFHAGVGFAMLAAIILLKGLDKIPASLKVKRMVVFVSSAVLVFLCGCKTWERNWDWKNDVTLFLKDVKNAPNSVLVLGNAGARWIDLADTKEITGFNIPGQDSTIVNDYNGQLHISDAEVKAGGFKNKKEAALQRGIGYLKHAIDLHPTYVNGYLNLGLAEFKLGHDQQAIFYWENARYLYPDNPYLKLYYSVYGDILKQRAEEAMQQGNAMEAVKQLRYLIVIAGGKSAPWQLMAKAYRQLGKAKEAKVCLVKAEEMLAKDKARQ